VEELRLEIELLRLGPNDEDDLRRRFMLPRMLPTPEPGKDYTSVASELVKRLPITMGYAVPDAPTRWRTDSADHRQYIPFQPGQEGDWQRLISPRVAMTNQDPVYDARRDTYDRRRLLTVNNSDDALRPQRDERRLQTFTVTLGTPSVDEITFNLENLISPVDAGLRSPATVDPQTRPLAYGVMDQRLSGGQIEHVFNTVGLRTQFSLRDVLEPSWDGTVWTGKPSYRRAMQLTAWFLAMLQHTTVPGSNSPTPSQLDLAEQLRTAMQLAVNAIDFADEDGHLDDDSATLGTNILDQVSTCLTLDVDGPLGLMPPITVCGVEKQPFITEAYVKRIKFGEDRGTGMAWQEDDDSVAPAVTYSIYAVELYNPYDVYLDLTGYAIRTGAGNDIDLGTRVGWMAPQSYVVVANRKDDLSPPGRDPFITDAIDASAPQPLTATPPANLFIDPSLKIDETNPIRLVRKIDRLMEVTPAGLQQPVSFSDVEIDRMDPTAPGALAGLGIDLSVPLPWALDAEDLAVQVFKQSSGPPVDPGKWLVRDSSLQRHKDLAPNIVGGTTYYPPVYWHFTLSRQMLFPLPWYEHPDYPDPAAPQALLPNVIDTNTDPPRPDQHNLLNTGTFVGPDGLTNAPLVYNTTVAANSLDPPILDFPQVAVERFPIAPFPVVTADRGIHPGTLGTMAFPTTGTLLLVTRYGQLVQCDPDFPTKDLPFTVAATRVVPGCADRPSNPIGQLVQMCQLDNGHLPIFDSDDPRTPFPSIEGQTCLDGNNSRFGQVATVNGNLVVVGGLPWGQLVFEYFTALPFEELARDLDFVNAGVQNLMSLAPSAYRDEYGAAGGAWNDANKWRFLNYPVMMPVSQAASPLGPRVQGRINIGVAPWWVLDGLPVLPDAPIGDPNNAIPPGSYVSLAGLPVPEIEAVRLDPPPDPNPNVRLPMVGALFVHDLIDEMYRTPVLPYTSTSMPPAPPAGMPSISPKLAQYLVSYREERQVGTRTALVSGRVGFATTGELCNVVQLARCDADLKIGSTTRQKPNLDELRLAINDLATPPVRPFGYLGYLQLVTPIVRLEDWTTVKNHVFTVYATIQSTGQPPVAVRTQMTIDRTRCLYNPADLPERITETEPISYYNAMDD
jgi:hypothetical protein